jgi:CheY-like chemotaxis protein
MRDQLRDIVVVDDDPTLLSVLSDVFNEDGYTVRTAADGFSALAAIRDRMPDILVSDLNMPHMSGYELLSVVRRRFPAIIVIAMSGAYAGSTTPPGVAADGFYAKGSGRPIQGFQAVPRRAGDCLQEVSDGTDGATVRGEAEQGDPLRHVNSAAEVLLLVGRATRIQGTQLLGRGLLQPIRERHADCYRSP